MTISDESKSQNIVSIDRYKETRDDVKHGNTSYAQRLEITVMDDQVVK